MTYVESAKQTIREILLAGRPLVVPWSGGRDSSSVLNLSVVVAAGLVEQGFKVAPLFVINADVIIENPAVSQQLQKDLRRLKDYCKEHLIPLSFHQSTPALGSEWVVKIFSGRNLPIFANRKFRDCSTDLKGIPLERLKRSLMKHIEANHGKPVSALGTRFCESTQRRDRMESRGETAEEIWSSGTSGDMISPIANWSDKELWQYISAVTNGQEEGFTDFRDLTQLYWDGSDHSRILFESDSVPNCRYGCSMCCVGARDRSMENLLKNNPERYGYMLGLNKLRNFLVATQFDLDRRQWIGRSIVDGYLAIYPDTYSAQMLEDLFLMALTIDVREEEAAGRLGIAPRFKLLHPRAIIAICAIWSMQGLHSKPFHGLYLYNKVYNEGFRIEVPEVTPGKPVKIPEKRYLYVGEGWTEQGSEWEYAGMRDATLEMVSDQDGWSGCGVLEGLKDGRQVQQPAYSESGLFDVDLESAYMVFDWEIENLLRHHDETHYYATFAYNRYVTLGVIQLSSRRQSSTSDFILRRTNFREKEGLIGANFDLQKVLSKTISKKEMLAEVARRNPTPPIITPSVAQPVKAQMELFTEVA